MDTAPQEVARELPQTPDMPTLDPQEAVTLTPVPAITEKKTRTAKREVANLDEVNPNKMTDAERIMYIKALREEINKLSLQCQAYAKNSQSAFAKARDIEQTFQEYRLKATAKLNFARQAIDHCRTSIILAGTLED